MSGSKHKRNKMPFVLAGTVAAVLGGAAIYAKATEDRPPFEYKPEIPAVGMDPEIAYAGDPTTPPPRSGEFTDDKTPGADIVGLNKYTTELVIRSVDCLTDSEKFGKGAQPTLNEYSNLTAAVGEDGYRSTADDLPEFSIKKDELLGQLTFRVANVAGTKVVETTVNINSDNPVFTGDRPLEPEAAIRAGLKHTELTESVTVANYGIDVDNGGYDRRLDKPDPMTATSWRMNDISSDAAVPGTFANVNRMQNVAEQTLVEIGQGYNIASCGPLQN